MSSWAHFFDRKTALVTGASSGIGRAVALQLAECGANVIAVARDTERLKQLGTEWETKRLRKEQKFSYFSKDLCREDEIATLAQEVSPVPLDVLIHSAGVSYPQLLPNTSTEQIQKMMQTNLLAPIQLTRALLPRMQARRSGSIGFVSSIAGEANIIGYATYSATKGGLTSFADALRNELAADGISVTVILPPDTDTPMLEGERKLRHEISEKLAGATKLLSATTVAHALLKAMARKRFKLYPDFTSWFFGHALRLLPTTVRRILDAQVRQLTKKLLRTGNSLQPR